MIKYVTKNDSNEVELDITVNNVEINGRKVTNIYLVAGEDFISDLRVSWDAVDDNNYEDGNSMLLMRNINSEDVNTATMGEFYCENAFDEELHAILKNAGFSADAAEDVCGSEWGMQDVGAASYDANACAEEMLAQFGLVYEY